MILIANVNVFAYIGCSFVWLFKRNVYSGSLLIFKVIGGGAAIELCEFLLYFPCQTFIVYLVFKYPIPILTGCIFSVLNGLFVFTIFLLFVLFCFMLFINLVLLCTSISQPRPVVLIPLLHPGCFTSKNLICFNMLWSTVCSPYYTMLHLIVKITLLLFWYYTKIFRYTL